MIFKMQKYFIDLLQAWAHQRSVDNKELEVVVTVLVPLYHRHHRPVRQLIQIQATATIYRVVATIQSHQLQLIYPKERQCKHDHVEFKSKSVFSISFILTVNLCYYFVIL